MEWIFIHWLYTCWLWDEPAIWLLNISWSGFFLVYCVGLGEAPYLMSTLFRRLVDKLKLWLIIEAQGQRECFFHNSLQFDTTECFLYCPSKCVVLAPFEIPWYVYILWDLTIYRICPSKLSNGAISSVRWQKSNISLNLNYTIHISDFSVILDNFRANGAHIPKC